MDFVEHIYGAHIQPKVEFWHDDLFDESDEYSNMFVENSSEDSDNEDGNSK